MELKNVYEKVKKEKDLLIRIDQYIKEGRLPEKGNPWEVLDDNKIFFDVISIMSAQSKAPEFEKFLAKKLNWTKISASKNKGDYYDKEKDCYIELKASFSNEKETLNFRQIRLWQDVKYYLGIYINEKNIEESKVYLLTKDEMIEEVNKSGSATHGTKEANEFNQNIEYSITVPMYKGEKYEDWKKYENIDIYNILFK